MAQDINPVDAYLAKLAENKQQFEERLPKLVEGVNSLFGTDVTIPNGIPINQKAQKASGADRGQVNFAPGINTPKPNLDGTADYVNNLLNSSMLPGAVAPSDAIHSAGLVGFGASTNKNNFDRYYNHNQYKNLGWNPYVDNEAIYNKNSSWLDDFGRASSQWGSLAMLGAKQTLGNWDDLFTLNTEGDTKYAREMNRMMSIANSSRGGLGGFATNLYANSAYTFGVIGEAVAEEVALWAGTALTAGALGETAFLRTTTLGKRLFKANQVVSEAEKLAQQAKNVAQAQQSLNTAMNAVDNVSDAKKFWKGVADFVNPLGQTTETVGKIKTGADGFDKLTDFAKNAKTFGAFFKDMRMLNMTLAESRLEGGMVENDTFNELYSEHLKNNGKPPEGQEAEKMIAQAKAAGVKTTLANAPAIFFSNKIVFDKLLNGFKPFKDIGKGALGVQVIDKSAIGQAGKKVYRGFINPSETWRKVWYNKLHQKHVMNQFKPKNLMKNGLRYASANLVEGLQESYQEGISAAMKDYFINTYASPERAGTAYMGESLARGFGEQFTGQGAETFLSGFLMGGLVQGPQTMLFTGLPNVVGKGYNKIFDKEAYDANAKRQKEIAEQQQRITDFQNEIQSDPRKFYDRIYENVQSQKDFASLMDNAEEAGDQKEHKDAKNDSLFNHVTTLLDSGYIDMFTDQIDSFKELNDNELAEAFAHTEAAGKKDEFNKDIRSRLDSIKGKVEQIKGLHEKYSGITNPYNMKSDNFDEVFDGMGFEHVRRLAIYNEYSFQQNIKRMGSLLSDASNAGMGSLNAGSILFLFSTSALQNVGYRLTENGPGITKSRLELEIDQLKEEAKSYAQGNEEQQKIGKQKEALAGILTQYNADFEGYVKAYKDAKSSALSDEKSTEHKQNLHLSNQLAEGSNVEYTFKNGNKITGKVISKTQGKVTIEYEENGKTVTKTVSAKAKKLTLLDGPKNATEPGADATAIEAEMETRKKALMDRAKEYLAAVSGMPANSEQFDKIIGHIVDFAELSQDTQKFMSAVNLLNDPGNFSIAAQAFSKGKKDAFQIAQTNLKSSLETYKKRMATNQLLSELFKKFNVFLIPEDIDKLMKDDTFPIDFYEQNVKTDEISPISPNSKRYTDILDFLEEFTSREGVTLKGRPILQAPNEVNIYDVVPVEKAPNMKDIMDALGLKPGQKSYTITVADLITFILNERLGSRPSLDILQKLRTMVDPSQTMILSTQERDGFSFTKDGGLIIDPRFATREYSFKNDKGKFVTASLGYLLVNGLTQMVVSENSNDPQFKNAVDELMDAVKAYLEANPTIAEKTKISVNYGMASREKFIAMALSDSTFQGILAIVPYKNKNTNLWKQLIISIGALLKKIFKGKYPISDNALEEVLGIMSNRFKGNPINATAAAPITAVTRTDKQAVTTDTPMEEIIQDHPDLYEKLYALFDEENNASSTPRPAEEMGDWFKEASPAVDSLVTTYNKINNLVLSPENKDALEKLRAKKKQERKDALIQRIATTKTHQLLRILNLQADSAFLDTNGITREEFNNAIEARKKELGPDLPTFESINGNHILIMKDKKAFSSDGYAAVISEYNPTTKTITIFDVADPDSTPIELTESEYKSQVEAVITGNTPPAQKPAVKPEEKQASNESVNTSLDINDTNLIQEDTNAAKDLGEEEAGNDLFNNLDCE